MSLEPKRDFMARMKAGQETSLQQVLSQPAIKLMISMVPPPSQPELLRTLIETVYDAGIAYGVGKTLEEMLTSISKTGGARP